MSDLPPRSPNAIAIWFANSPVMKPSSQQHDEDPAVEPTPQENCDAALSKTKLCKFFSRGACQRGEACTFAHGRGQLQRRRPGARKPDPDIAEPLCLSASRFGLQEARAARGRRRSGANGREGAAERCAAQRDRDAMAQQLAEARLEAAQLQAQVQLLRGSGAAATPQRTAPDLPDSRPARGLEADLAAQAVGESSRYAWAAHRYDDSGVTFTVNNTFLDVASSVSGSEHHRRTSSVPPRNQWLDLWLQHVADSDAQR